MRITEKGIDITIITAIYCYGKNQRRAANQSGFEPAVPPYNPDDWLSTAKAGFNVLQQFNRDCDGDPVGTISSIILSHPLRASIAPNLTDYEIMSICSETDCNLEEDEMVAQSEGWSIYNIRPEEFPVMATAGILLRRRESWRLSGEERENLVNNAVQARLGKGGLRQLR